jgi:DNA-binding protein H-NS
MINPHFLIVSITMSDLQSLSANELQEIINNAEKALKNIQFNKRREVIAQIKELAASIDMTADVYETDKKLVRKGSKVAIKYRDPNNPENTWTGRGVMPRWLRDQLNTGRDRSEFEV